MRDCGALSFRNLLNERLIDQGPLGWPLELDGYNEDLQLAFEYNGEQHYHSNHYWNLQRLEHHTPVGIADAWKAKICRDLGVKLLIVPYWVSDLHNHIRFSLLPWYSISEVNPLMIEI